MNLHMLVFTRLETQSATTKVAHDLLTAAAVAEGHELTIISDFDCQMHFGNETSVFIRNTPAKDINVLFVRANLSGAKLQFRRTLIKQFELMGIPVVNREEAVMNAKNKLRNLQVLTEHNIPIPKTYVVSHAGYLDDALKDIGRFPIILKTPSGSQGKGVAIIESKRGLKSVIEMFDNGEPIVLQQYVKESSGKDIRVFVVGDRVIGAMKRETTRRGEFRSNFHLGGKVSVADLTKGPKGEKQLALNATRACGLDIAGVDILRTQDGPKVIEVNANPGLEGITQATGKNIAGEIIRFMVSKVPA
ncbi:MAG: RimK family alpha-L-glutamate ligase [Deltaproteobacteria bacterium]|nr:RimK family alpha-L-glutamate ligase [Deltaproteobacteria bacterium]